MVESKVLFSYPVQHGRGRMPEVVENGWTRVHGNWGALNGETPREVREGKEEWLGLLGP